MSDVAIAELRALVADQPRCLTVPLEVRDAPAGREDVAFVLTGHAAVFEMLSEDLGGFRERIKRGFFKPALDENHDVRMLWEHDPRWLLARTANNTLELREDPRGLYTHAEVAATSYAADLQVLLKRQDVTQQSFSFTVAEDLWTIEGEGASRQVYRDLVKIKRLYDVSPVAYPAYPQTDAKAGRSWLTVPEQDNDQQRVLERALYSVAQRLLNGAASGETPTSELAARLAESGDNGNPEGPGGLADSANVGAAFYRASLDLRKRRR